MPRVKRYVKKRRVVKRKRVFKRRAGKYGGRQGLMLANTANILSPYWGRNPYPPGERVTLPFFQAQTLSTGVSAFGTEHSYRLNSPYDPDYTGVGHQPNAYPQFAARYNKYRVDSVRVWVAFTTPGDTRDIWCCATFAPNLSSTLTGATIYNGMETPGGWKGLLSPTGERRCELEGTFQLHEIIGVSRAKYEADDTFVGGTGSNPAQLCLMNIAGCCADGTGSVNFTTHVCIEFNVWFFDRVSQN